MNKLHRENKTISILGCGWLGLPLAESLVKKGYVVNGSTTTKEKNQQLAAKNIIPFHVLVEAEKITGDIKGLLSNSEVLIVNIPPKLTTTRGEKFIKRIKNLVFAIEQSNLNKVFYVSSTSVYKNDSEYSLVDESSEYLSNSLKSKTLLEAENLFFKNKHFNSTIIRFSGLIGKDRHPAKYLSGKTQVKNPDAPVNLIHLNDCIDIIGQLIEKDVYNQIFNASYPEYPKRIMYYTRKCKEMGLLPPKFLRTDASVGKKILSKQLQTQLNFNFKHTII